jgi:hypothetical protein
MRLSQRSHVASAFHLVVILGGLAWVGFWKNPGDPRYDAKGYLNNNLAGVKRNQNNRCEQ